MANKRNFGTLNVSGDIGPPSKIPRLTNGAGVGAGGVGATPLDATINSQPNPRSFGQFFTSDVVNNTSSLKNAANPAFRSITTSGGESLYSLLPITSDPMSNLMGSMQVKNWRQAMPNAIPQQEDQFNSSTRVRYWAKPYKPETPDAINVNDLCIMMIDKNGKSEKGSIPISRLSALFSRSFSSGVGVSGYPLNYSDTSLVEGGLLHIMNIPAFNHLLLQMQAEIFNESPEKFYELSPESIWTNFTFAGVASAVENAFRGDSITSGNGVQVRGNGTKLLTMIIEGEAMVPNWFGPHTGTGSNIFAVLKKFDIPSSYRFMFDESKGVTSSRIGNDGRAQAIRNNTSYVNTNEMIAVRKAKSVTNDGLYFRPYQMALISDPTAPLVCRSRYTSYMDEWGVERKDGIAVNVGTVVSRPYPWTEKRYNSQDPASMTPCINANEGRHVDTDDMQILLKFDKARFVI